MNARPSTAKKWLRRVAFALLSGIILFVVASCYFAYKLTGPRHGTVGSLPEDFPSAVEEVSWITSDGLSIKGWLIAAPDSDRGIVLMHGYGGNRRQMLSRSRAFHQVGYNVLLYDARACGESEGGCVTFGYHEAPDLLGALEFLRRRGVDRIACLGVSQGGATILLAAEQLGDVRCVVCESVFDELDHAVNNRFRHYCLIPGWLGGCLMVPIAERRTGVPLDQVRPVEHIGNLRCPVFIIGGENDTKTLPAETRRLFTAAPPCKRLWLVPDAGHRDLYGSEYMEKVLSFVEESMN